MSPRRLQLQKLLQVLMYEREMVSNLITCINLFNIYAGIIHIILSNGFGTLVDSV